MIPRRPVRKFPGGRFGRRFGRRFGNGSQTGSGAGSWRFVGLFVAGPRRKPVAPVRLAASRGTCARGALKCAFAQAGDLSLARRLARRPVRDPARARGAF